MAQSWADTDDFAFEDDPVSSTPTQTFYGDMTSSSSSSFPSRDHHQEDDSSRASSYKDAKDEVCSSSEDEGYRLASDKSVCDNVNRVKHKHDYLTCDTSVSLKECSPSSSRRPSYPSSESPTYRGQCAALQVEDMAKSGLWVFGYGSLCWHQGFDFSDSKMGFILGFSRRFWQGNVTHRGTDEKPGRVATLVEDSEGIVWGQAFQVCGEAALPYLNNRECELGGYRTTLTTFHPRDGSASFPAVLYVAMPNNRHWLGDGPLPSIADEIVESKGASGHNVEYLLRLAEFLRQHIPEACDDHVFGLEALVRDRVVSRQLCLRTLMGEAPTKAPAVAAEPAPAPARTSAQFSNRVPSKKLRCVNI